MAVVMFWFYGANGALIPFFTLYLYQVGLSPTEISILMSILPLLLFVSQPVFGLYADRSGHRGLLLARLLVVIGLSAALIPLGRSFMGLLPLVILWGFFTGPLIPLADSIALGESQRTGVYYPRIRLWGSAGFLIISTILGMVYQDGDLGWAFWAYALIQLIAAWSAKRLPSEGISKPRPLLPILRAMVNNPRLLGFLLVSAVLHLTLSAHHVFFSLHFTSIGGTSTLLGIAWALAALVEIPIWIFMSRITRWTGVPLLLVIGSLVYALRWWLIAAITDPVILVAAQVLQGLSYGIVAPTLVILMGELSPPDLRTSGQTLLGLANGGVATVCGTLLAGWIAERYGTAALYYSLGYVATIAAVGFMVMALVFRPNRERGVSHG